MKAPDLYSVLGLSIDADAAAIHRAYRKAAKKAHPDMPGGSDNRFALVRLALDTLGDEHRRAHYDETGEVEEKPVDNARTNAMQCVAAALQATLAAAESANTDPMTVDLPQKMRFWINEHLKESRSQIAAAQKVIARDERLVERFDAEFMRDIVHGSIAMNRQRIANMERNQKMGKDALELLTDVHFDCIVPPKPEQPAAYQTLFQSIRF